MRDHVARLDGARLTGFVCDGVTEAWIDFEYGGHSFSINDPLDTYWFFVRDPSCAEALLQTVVVHFSRLGL